MTMSSDQKGRGRRDSRSYSPASRRSRTRSGDSFYSYSDSFVSDSEDKKKQGGKKMYSNTKPYEKGRKRTDGRRQGKSKPIDPRNFDQVAQRMLSARRLKINDLKNENDELRHALDEFKNETKVLKTTYRRQEKALQKFEGQESEFSSIITRHNEEVRSLKDQIRKYRSRAEHNRKLYHDVSDELHKSRSENKKLKDLVERKELQERGDLDRKLTNAEIELDQKDRRIRELERHIDNLNKNHKHELAIEIHRHKDTKSQLDVSVRQNQDLERQLSAKTKAMEATNIYSNRGSRQRSPAARKQQNSDLESVAATPRDKAERQRQYEQRRRERAKKRSEAKQRLEEKRRVENDEEEEEEMKNLESSDEEPKWQYEKADKLNFSFTSDTRKSKDNEEFFETKKKVDSPEIPYEPTFTPPKRELRRVETPPREPSPPPREPTPPRELTPPPPKEPTPTPPKEPTPPPPEPEKEEPALAEQRRKKDLLLARLRALDEQKDDSEDTPDPASSKPRYSFSKPIDNLHHGLPAHDDVKVPYIERRKSRQSSVHSDSSIKRVDDDSNKKKDLMNVLFSESPSSEKKDSGDEKPRKQSYDLSGIGYQPSTGPRRNSSQQIVNKPLVSAVDDHVHDDEIEELTL